MCSLPLCLTCFQAACAIGGAWKDFVASQPGLSELYLDGEFCGAVPESMMLPNLQSLKARPTDIARFVETHALCDAWFFTGAPLGTETLSAVELTVFDNAEYCLTSLRISAPDFVLLSAAALEFLEVLRHLVLDKDLTWADFTLELGAHCVAGSTFGRVATVLDGQFIHLKSVLLVCARSTQGRSQRWPLLVSDAKCFSKVLALHSNSPSEDGLFDGDGLVLLNCLLRADEDLKLENYSCSRLTHECPPTFLYYLIFNAGSFSSHCPFILWRRSSDALLPTPAQITPTPAVPHYIKDYFTVQMARPLNTHGRSRDVSELRRWSIPSRRIAFSSFFETSDLFGIALGLIHTNPVDSDAVEEDYGDMPALEGDLSNNSCVDSLKSKFRSSMQATLVLDSDSEDEAPTLRDHDRQEDLIHSSLMKAKRAPERDLLASDWPSQEDSLFPFAGKENFLVFDAAHPLDPGPRKGRDSDHPMAQWVSHRQRFLEELLRLEGCGDHRHQSKCTNCDVAAVAAVWCGKTRLCLSALPLKSLGLHIQLGHGHNGICPGTVAKRAAVLGDGTRDDWHASGGPETERRSWEDFCIMDSNRIHEVALDFCSCGWAEDHDAKSSVYHFYNKLARQTDNSGVFQPRTRYAEFCRMTRQWRHLQMLKRAGRGHAADGIEGTKAGECALLCSACPQPGKSLPADRLWKLVPRATN
ncbi:hypothetical protein DFH08DRAFT_798339 [Mycena albidolilacea]|uniref:CxC2-like cysteine cluster KDZ transposase-associated domain-containing protein n=1 Tax=Mycena albidolilacea TaxID=1033008 RepID=A0AAD7F153_9AGAR|nr:hypothetical protein DFH08DRAFT_798339 [Mycena albidolilacea]